MLFLDLVSNFCSACGYPKTVNNIFCPRQDRRTNIDEKLMKKQNEADTRLN